MHKLKMDNTKDLDIIKDMVEGVNTILDDTKDINQLLALYSECDRGYQYFDKLKERIKIMIKVYLKERKWERYLDSKSKISVSITTQKREDIDKQQLNIMLTDAQLAQVTRTTTFERMNIITPKTRERLKKYVK